MELKGSNPFMGTPVPVNREERAERLAHQQREKLVEFLQPPAENLAGGQEETRLETLAEEIQYLHQRFRQTPLTGRKIWAHLCFWTWAIMEVSLLLSAPLGGLILTPFTLGGLWIVLNLPTWLSAGLSSGGRNTHGKYV